jgi:hypothetical protein
MDLLGAIAVGHPSDAGVSFVIVYLESILKKSNQIIPQEFEIRGINGRTRETRRPLQDGRAHI